MQRLRQRYVQSSVQISEAEIDQMLATRLIGGPEVRLANIQISLAEGATPDDIAVAKNKIDEIKGMIDRGELDFRSAAIRYSQAQNALDGGEIGWRTMDSVPPAFAAILQSMKPGQVTDAVRGPSGFQIVQLEEVRQPQQQKVTQYRAQDILVATSDSVSADVARMKIDALRARIVAGEDFAAVAKEASDDTQTRAQGGDMGWFQADAWGSAIGSPGPAAGRWGTLAGLPERRRLPSDQAHRQARAGRDRRKPAQPGARDHRPTQGRRILRSFSAPAPLRSVRG